MTMFCHDYGHLHEMLIAVTSSHSDWSIRGLPGSVVSPFLYVTELCKFPECPIVVLWRNITRYRFNECGAASLQEWEAQLQKCIYHRLCHNPFKNINWHTERSDRLPASPMHISWRTRLQVKRTTSQTSYKWQIFGFRATRDLEGVERRCLPWLCASCHSLWGCSATPCGTRRQSAALLRHANCI